MFNAHMSFGRVSYTPNENQVPAFDVYLVGGQDLAFEGLKALLTRHGFHIAGLGRTLREIAVQTERDGRHFLVIVEVPDAGSWALEELPRFRERYPRACLVVLLEGLQRASAFLPEEIEANAIVDRNVACDALLKSLNLVMAGYGVLSPIVRSNGDLDIPRAGRVPAQQPVEQGCKPGTREHLSERELEIIGSIAEGQSNKVIARRCAISESTVKIHVRGILRKINVRNRTQAAVWALHRGFGSSAVALD